MSVKGDFAKLNGFIARLKDLFGAGPRSRVSRSMGQEALKLVKRGFREETDPYGDKWAPHSPKTKKRSRSRILKRSGAALRNWSMGATRNGFVLSTLGYIGVHQHGADYTAKGRVTFRSKKGRFSSTASAHKRAASRKAGSVKVAPHGAHRIVIPRRMVVPVEALGLGRWHEPLARVAKRDISRILRGR